MGRLCFTKEFCFSSVQLFRTLCPSSAKLKSLLMLCVNDVDVPCRWNWKGDESYEMLYTFIVLVAAPRSSSVNAIVQKYSHNQQ
ncbi:hypothetical protein Y032_0619g732 [Ancylostoma ceylanicum]|nr:hypothetical protein Y032_0619g732 [Ancylostoma ceylanicum]